MNDMIERVAKVLCQRAGNDVSIVFAKGAKKYGPIATGLRDKYLNDARAAIEAMRDPTEEMVERGLSKPNDFQHGHITVTEIYEAMIDAALNPSQT